MKPEQRINELNREVARLQARVTELDQLLLAAQTTNARLNRRCTDAEGAARANVEACRKAGQSLGRQLAHWAAADAARQADDLRIALAKRVLEAEALERALREANEKLRLAPPKETAETDRSAICELGRLLLAGDSPKQCYSSDAVVRMVKKLLEEPAVQAALAEALRTAPSWVLGLPVPAKASA